MKSIQRTLNLRQILIQVAVFAVFSVGIYQFVKTRLLHEFDHNLETLVNAGFELVEIEHKKGRTKIEIEDDHAPAYDHQSTILLLRDDQGKIHFNPDQTNLENWTPPTFPESGSSLGSFHLPDGRPARYMVSRFMPEIERKARYTGGEWSITVIRERSSIDQALNTILYGCLALGAAAILLSTMVNYFIIRRGLDPLNRMGNELNQLEASSLNHRFATDSLPQELQPVTLKLNELFERVETSFQREQRFTNNAAHELRTPLAELQTILQVGQKWRPEDIAHENPAQYFSDGAQVTKRMSHLIETLFTLSRTSSEPLDIEPSEFCLTSTLKRHLASQPQPQRIQFLPSHPIHVICDQNLLMATFTNLLSNALSHSAGQIDIELIDHKDTVSFRITNPAPDLTQEDIKHLREPFWRKESSRTNQDHLGLGLNLVEQFCSIQNLDLEFSLTDKAQFCVTVARIPVHKNPSASPTEPSST